MAVLSVRVPDELAARFDAAAALSGGRSALLHRLVREAAVPDGSSPGPAAGRRNALRLMVRLARAEATHVEREAAAMAMTQSAWVAALVRRHRAGEPCFSRKGELALLAIQAELRRIGVNVNQIARALNTAVMEGRVLESELSAIEDLRREQRAHIMALRDAFSGNLAYWEVDP